MTRAARFAWLAREQARTGISRAGLETLLDRYGSRALQVADYITLGQDEQLLQQPEYSRREIEFLALSERVIHLDDLVLRRTLLAILGQTTRPLLEELAEVVSPVLGWPRRAAMDDVERCLRILQEVHGVTAARLER
jgi:glycerol-3-phosphate dehydrogenase